MGMGTHVVGFKPADEKWRKMRDVWQACIAADLAIPDEVGLFFEWDPPDERGVKISESDLKKYGAVREWNEEDRRIGFEVDVTKLPKDVTVIRFYNSW